MAVNKSPRKILIIQTAFLGDVVLATALAEKLYAHYPNSNIHFLVRKGNEELLHQHPFISHVWVFNKQKKLRAMWQLVSAFRKIRFDLIVNVHRFLSSALIALASGAKQVVGFDKSPLSRWYHYSYPHRISSQSTQHETERNQQLISHLTNTQAALPRLYPGQKDYANIPLNQIYVCIAPASVWFTKQWPAHKWVAFINQLPSELTIYLLGAPNDKPLCEFIKNACSKPKHEKIHIKAGQLSLLESATYMQHAKMNYVNDSAPLHLASAVNAPVTAIFCSTVPAFGFTPLSQNSHVVQYSKALSCRPCGLHGYRQCPKQHFKCADIPVTKLIVP